MHGHTIKIGNDGWLSQHILNGVCVCVVFVKHIVQSIIHGLDFEHLARAYMYYDLNST